MALLGAEGESGSSQKMLGRIDRGRCLKVGGGRPWRGGAPARSRGRAPGQGAKPPLKLNVNSRMRSAISAFGLVNLRIIYLPSTDGGKE